MMVIVIITDITVTINITIYIYIYVYIHTYIYTHNLLLLLLLLFATQVRRREHLVGVSMVGVNSVAHDATCECFEGIMLEPCLRQPCFHVAGNHVCCSLFLFV